MINQTFLHCPGIGLKTEERLKASGFECWQDCLNHPELLPFKGNKQKQFLLEIEKSQLALKNHDLGYLVEALPTREHWRILGEYFKQATFFDIETTGLSSYDSMITVITAFHQGKLHTFLFQENLADFLNLVENSTLLVAFNGNSFDIPFIENEFNIPSIDCPFVDLRWICYHEEYRGGLKSIEKQLYIKRPQEIEGVDGFEAVSLFLDWQNGDFSAKKKLIDYCQADVLCTYLVAQQLLLDMGYEFPYLSPGELFQFILP